MLQVINGELIYVEYKQNSPRAHKPWVDVSTVVNLDIIGGNTEPALALPSGER